jgi:hypothetical protein
VYLSTPCIIVAESVLGGSSTSIITPSAVPAILVRLHSCRRKWYRQSLPWRVSLANLGSKEICWHSGATACRQGGVDSYGGGKGPCCDVVYLLSWSDARALCSSSTRRTQAIGIVLDLIQQETIPQCLPLPQSSTQRVPNSTWTTTSRHTCLLSTSTGAPRA